MTGNQLREIRKGFDLSQAKWAFAMKRHPQTIAQNEQKGEGVVAEWLADAARELAGRIKSGKVVV